MWNVLALEKLFQFTVIEISTFSKELQTIQTYIHSRQVNIYTEMNRIWKYYCSESSENL